MHAFNSEGVYQLFETGSPEPTRAWSREQYVCKDNCISCDISNIKEIPTTYSQQLLSEKLKYVVLKNPPSTAPPKQAGWASKSLNTILLNNVLYKVDPLVFPYLSTYNIQSCVDLKKAIAEIRMIYDLPVPDGVRLASIPLVQKVVKRQFLAGNNTKPGQYITEAFRFPYKLSDYKVNYAEVKAAVQQFALDDYIFFECNNAKLFSAVTNNRCDYTSLIDDFYDAASIWGKHILAVASLKLYKETGNKTFLPIWAVLTPPNPWIYNGTCQNYVGLLVGINGQVVFVPTYSATSTYIPIPNTYFSVLISSTNTKLFAVRVKQLAIDTSVHYKLLR